MIHLIQNKVPCFLTIIYYRPQSLLLQEFGWEVDDIVPEHPRIHRFLDYWYENINAVIREARIVERYHNEIRAVDLILPKV